MQKNLKSKVMTAARINGVSSVLFRNAVGYALGLSVTESECLSYVSMQGQATPTDIARYTGHTSGSTTAMLDKLEKKGYLKRSPNPHDRRGIIITVDKKYLNQTASIVHDLHIRHQQLLDTYTDDQLQTIAHFLTEFSNNVTMQTTALNHYARNM